MKISAEGSGCRPKRENEEVSKVAEGEAASTNAERRILGESEVTMGKLVQQNPATQPPICFSCSSVKVWKDGLRYNNGEPMQRWLCRRCGYRFSQPKVKVYIGSKIREAFKPCKNHTKRSVFGVDSSFHKADDDLPFSFSEDVTSHNASTAEKELNSLCFSNRNRQVCELAEDSKNLEEEATRQEWAAGATITPPISGLILEYAWQAKKRGLAESTIQQRVQRLKLLVKRGAELRNADSVSTVLATSSWTDANKRVFIVAYQSFARFFNISWVPPKTRVERKLPFIPTEEEINQLIAGCGKNTATFLQVLKDTGARTAEAIKLRWSEVDEKSSTIRINSPVKGSLARVVKVPSKTIAMIVGMPKTKEFIFNTNPHTIRRNFYKQRRRIAARLQNPRIREIRLHTFRHWKATMEYHRTKDSLYVKQLLGHKKLENTEIYTHLLNFENDEWNVAYAQNLEEESKLIEAGFEYVRFSDRDAVAIYRKRK